MEKEKDEDLLFNLLDEVQKTIQKFTIDNPVAVTIDIDQEENRINLEMIELTR